MKLVEGRPLRGIAALLFAAAAVAIGCGGGDGPSGAPGPEAELEAEGEEAGLSEEERELAERADAAAEIPEADRVAYYQLATASGLLRARALAQRRGDPIPPDSTDPALRATQKRLDQLGPADHGLSYLDGRLAVGIGAVLHSPDGAGAGVALRAVDRVNRELRDYVHREPLIAVLAPD